MQARKQLRYGYEDNQPQASTPYNHKASSASTSFGASFGIENLMSGEMSGFAPLLDPDSTLNLEMTIDNNATATTDWDKFDFY